MALSDLRFFGVPTLTAESEIYDLKQRPACGYDLESGSFFGTAGAPAHGSDANLVSGSISYLITRTFGSPFSSSMVGADIRLNNISINSLQYIDINGIKRTFTGSVNVDFVSKIKSVVNTNTLMIEDPFTISAYALTPTVSSEDSPYYENTQIVTEKIDSFNETDLYLSSGKFSGTEQELASQVYNVKVSYRNNYYVSNIKSGSYQIIHSP